MPPTKTSRAIAHYRAGRVQQALALAKTFRLGLTDDERAKLARAHECHIRPEFYQALGFDPTTEIANGKAVFEERIIRP